MTTWPALVMIAKHLMTGSFSLNSFVLSKKKKNDKNKKQPKVQETKSREGEPRNEARLWVFVPASQKGNYFHA